MKCTRTDLGNGDFVITCSRPERRALCQSCGHREHELLCDFELAGAKAGKTCDRKLCSSCATRVQPGRDLCPAHAALSRKQASEAAGEAIAERGIEGARAYFAEHREDRLALGALAEAMRTSGLGDQAAAVERHREALNRREARR